MKENIKKKPSIPSGVLFYPGKPLVPAYVLHRKYGLENT
jgi:hypothetical protein